MAHVLKILRSSSINISTSTLTLTSNAEGYTLLNFVPNASTQAPDSKWQDVTETIDLFVEGASVAAMRASVNAIERMLVGAAERQRSGSGVRYYLQWQPHGDSTLWRSEILGGKVELTGAAAQAIPQAKLEVRITLTRRGWWEGDLTELALSSTLDAAYATGGRRIKNHRGGSDTNYVAIQAASITGMMPAPVNIQLKNTSGGAVDYRNWYIASNVWNNPALFNWYLQGEDRVAGYGSTQADENSSGGNYVALTVNLSSAIPWRISGTQAKYAAGHDFRVLMRMPIAATQTLYITPAMWGDVNIVRLTPFVKEITVTPAMGRLIDLGTLEIPPGLASLADQGAVRLQLDVRSEVSTTFNVDFLQLFPAYNTRHLIMRGNQILNGDYVTDAPIDNAAYSEELESGEGHLKHAIITALEEPIEVWPGFDHRFYLLHDQAAGAMVISNQTTVQAYYRPRIVTL